MSHESDGENHILGDLDSLLTFCLSVGPHFDFAVSRTRDEFDVVSIFLRTFLVVDVRKLFRVENHNGSDVFLMAQFFLGWCRVGFLTLNVFKVLGFHVAEGLVLQQHVIHEFIPLDTSV